MRSLRRALWFALLVVGAAAVVGRASFALAGPEQADVRPVTLTMFYRHITFYDRPSVDVEARLYGPAGLKATASDDRGDVDGRKTLIFYGSRIAPGDRIEFDLSDATSFEVQIPPLRVDVDPAARAVVGTAPSGAQLEIYAGRAHFWDRITDHELLGTVEADETGEFTLMLEPADEFAAGDPGFVRYVTAAGHTFFAQFAPFSARVVLDQGRIGGHASLGTTVEVAWRTEDGVTGEQSQAAGYYGGWDDYRVRYWEPAWEVTAPGIGPGTTLTVSQRSSPIASTRAFSVTLPDLRVFFDAGANAIRGSGPPDTSLQLEIASPDALGGNHWVEADVFSTTLTTNDRGAFLQSLTGVAELESGLKAVLSADMGGGRDSPCVRCTSGRPSERVLAGVVRLPDAGPAIYRDVEGAQRTRESAD